MTTKMPIKKLNKNLVAPLEASHHIIKKSEYKLFNKCSSVQLLLDNTLSF